MSTLWQFLPVCVLFERLGCVMAGLVELSGFPEGEQ